jgi:hypothetical protein
MHRYVKAPLQYKQTIKFILINSYEMYVIRLLNGYIFYIILLLLCSHCQQMIEVLLLCYFLYNKTNLTFQFKLSSWIAATCFAFM